MLRSCPVRPSLQGLRCGWASHMENIRTEGCRAQIHECFGGKQRWKKKKRRAQLGLVQFLLLMNLSPQSAQIHQCQSPISSSASACCSAVLFLSLFFAVDKQFAVGRAWAQPRQLCAGEGRPGGSAGAGVWAAPSGTQRLCAALQRLPQPPLPPLPLAAAFGLKWSWADLVVPHFLSEGSTVYSRGKRSSCNTEQREKNASWEETDTLQCFQTQADLGGAPLSRSEERCP